MPLSNATPPGMYPATAFDWPVTYRYLLSTSGGLHTQEITVNVPSLKDHVPETLGMGRGLWIAGIAPAMSITASMIQCTVKVWRVSSADMNGGALPAFGSRFAVPLSPAKTPCAVLHTQYEDGYSRRRLYFPMAPRGWVSGTQLNEQGAGELRSVLAGLYGGLKGSIENAPMEWLIAYPEAIKDPVFGLHQVGFRVVDWVRLCEYTVPLPGSF